MKNTIVFLLVIIFIGITGCSKITEQYHSEDYRVSEKECIFSNRTAIETEGYRPVPNEVTDEKNVLMTSENVSSTAADICNDSLDKDYTTINPEIITLKFYIQGMHVAYYHTESSSLEHFMEDSILLFDQWFGIKIINLWHDGNRIYADLDSSSIEEEVVYYSSELDLENMIIKTLSSYPNTEEIEILIDGKKGKFGNQTVYSTYKPKNYHVDWETAIVKFYFGVDDLYSDYAKWEYKNESISYANLLSDTKKYLELYCGITLTNIWYDNTKLIVDLDPSVYMILNAGSHAGIMDTGILVKTFSSYPGVEEIEFLIGGERNCWADHFSFDCVFVAEKQ
ncbi:MAG: hypothetical protein FWG61_09855 [Firmicutes bacterium]|nr:hypothetical protein [Bacillota bacterium]